MKGDAMRNYSFFAAVISALLVSGAAVAADTAPSTYRVSMQLHDGTTLVASPTLDVNAGEPATVMISDAEGHRYDVRVTPTAAEGGKVFVVSSIHVASGTTHYSSNPSLLMMPGEPSAIELGEDGPTSARFRVDFTVTAKPAS